MMNFKRLKGFRDILPEETVLFHRLEETAREVFEASNCYEIKLPILENVELFRKSIGESTDIVEKEMYIFEDKDGEMVALRPEGTASVVRAYIENGYHISSPRIKLYYMGPMFRRERPQKGRFRQFHQIGLESFGFSEASADAEVISIMFEIYRKLGVPGLRIALNSIGCESCRKKYTEKLVEFLKNHSQEICEDCKRRTNSNPLRFFDCKQEPPERKERAPRISEFLCKSCKTHFSDLLLYTGGLPVVEDSTLVRGLDYYTKTVFELYSEKEGRDFVLAAGGRYDLLVQQFGGPPTPAVGFAIGCERTIAVLSEPEKKRNGIFVAGTSPEFIKDVFDITLRIRKMGMRCDFSPSPGSLKSQLRRADKMNLRFVIIVGEDEKERGLLSIKDLEEGTQKTFPFSRLEEEIKLLCSR